MVLKNSLSIYLVGVYLIFLFFSMSSSKRFTVCSKEVKSLFAPRQYWFHSSTNFSSTPKSESFMKLEKVLMQNFVHYLPSLWSHFALTITFNSVVKSCLLLTRRIQVYVRYLLIQPASDCWTVMQCHCCERTMFPASNFLPLCHENWRKVER